MNFKNLDHFSAEEPFYNGYRLLSTMDRNGDKPEIFICTTNRTAGKTTFFNGMLVHNFIKKHEKFLLVYRTKEEAANCLTGFWKDIQKLFFPSLDAIEEPVIKGKIWGLSIGLAGAEEKGDFVQMGYAVSLNAADSIKKFSHVLSDVDTMLMDEFQTESGRYLKNECQKFISLHTSVSRGNGQMNRYVRTILIGNLIDLCNPYYLEMGITDSLRADTNFFRGEGYVIEQTVNSVAGQKNKESAFMRAFRNSDYNKLSEKEYLIDSKSFVDPQIQNRGLYMFTFLSNKTEYGLRYDDLIDRYIVSQAVDPYCARMYTTADTPVDGYMTIDKRLKDKTIKNYRNGKMIFKDIASRDGFLKFIARA